MPHTAPQRTGICEDSNDVEDEKNGIKAWKCVQTTQIDPQSTSLIMFSTKSLLFFSTAATLLASHGAAGQSWEVMVYEPSAGGTSSCTGGGTTISGTSVTSCREVGLGSNAASFKAIVDNGPPGAEFACKWLPLASKYLAHTHWQLRCFRTSIYEF